MPNTQTSPNMQLVVPVNLTDPTPLWGAHLFTCLYTVIDQHDHSSGKGIQVPTAGLNINADLTFGTFNATGFRSTRFNSQAAPLALGPDVGCLYNVLGDAYWNNGTGTAIQLTKSGAVNATFKSWNQKQVTTATYTINSTDPFAQFFVKLDTQAVTVNLPAANAVPAGTEYIFVDYLGASETHALSVVPNGADTINGVNATFNDQLSFGTLRVTCDGTSKWVAYFCGVPSLRTDGWHGATLNVYGIVQFPASVAAPGMSQLQSTTGAGNTTTITTQAAKAASNANGGTLSIGTGAGDGTGVAGTLQMAPGGVNAWGWLPWKGTTNSQTKIIQSKPWTARSTSASTFAIDTFVVQNNTSLMVTVKWVARDITTPATASIAGKSEFMVQNNAGAMTQQPFQIIASGAVGAEASGSGIASLPSLNFSGTTLNINMVTASNDTIDWQGITEIILC